MKTSKEITLKESTTKYILECIDFSESTTKPDNVIECCSIMTWLEKEIRSDKSVNKDEVLQIHTIQDWLQGQPSTLEIACYNSEIIGLLNKWGCNTDEERAINQWYYIIATRIKSMINEALKLGAK